MSKLVSTAGILLSFNTPYYTELAPYTPKTEIETGSYVLFTRGSSLTSFGYSINLYFICSDETLVNSWVISLIDKFFLTGSKNVETRHLYYSVEQISVKDNDYNFLNSDHFVHHRAALHNRVQVIENLINRVRTLHYKI